jgi:4-hydroxy-3-polyprenylbenzoate decarboxylase
VIEGYVDTSQTVWESDEAEEKKDFSSPFFPEYHGHEGRARNTYKFQATAITHRRDNPMFYVALAHSFEYIHMQAVTNYAALYEMFNRQWPGLVVDVNSLQAMKGWNGLVIQVHKRQRRDEEHITNLFMAAWAASSALRMVIIVDDDVDIYNAEEVLWALNTRVDPKTDLIMVPPGTRSAGQSGEVTSPVSPVWRMGFDATVPWDYRWQYWRGEFPKVDLEKWFTPKEIARVRAMQSDYARLIADKRV